MAQLSIISVRVTNSSGREMLEKLCTQFPGAISVLRQEDDIMPNHIEGVTGLHASHMAHCLECSAYVLQRYREMCQRAGELQDKYVDMVQKYEPELYSKMEAQERVAMEGK